jgi:signal transduction histidine kinase
VKQPVTSWIGPTVFEGPGEMAVLCREFPWESTVLGPVHKWPLSLRTIVNALLNSRHPMFLFWGSDLIQFYNDAYRPSFAEGPRHPAALGARAREFWTEIWDVIGPQIEGVMQRGEATWYEDQFLPILRNGQMEDVYWTYSYSPVRDDDGRINGTLVICQETTASVQTRAEIERARDSASRLQQLTAMLAGVNSAEQVASIVTSAGMEASNARTATIFTRSHNDLEQLLLVGHTGLPESVSRRFASFSSSAKMPAAKAVRSHQPIFIESRDELGRQFSDIGAVWETSGSHAAAVMPLMVGEECLGAISFTYGEPREFAPDDRSFLSALASQCAQALERARLFEAERDARAQAQAASKSKSEFLAVMSHELRTPLNAIGGYAELLEIGVHGPVTPEQRKALERIQMSQRHLLGLINAVLNYTRIEAGHVSYNYEPVAVGEALSACEALTLPQMKSKNLKFQFDSCEPSLTVYADREKLQQIVLNLLTNSMKFTEPGGTVTLSCGANDGRVEIRVSDSGSGIDKDQLERIFEPFVQVDARLTRTHDGVGLGLAISRDLARGMSGDLHVESVAGEGSTFTLTMPATSKPG